MIQRNYKRDIYIHQFNAPSSRSLTPLAAGLLKSYALSISAIDDAYNVHIDVVRDVPEKVVDKYRTPDIIAFSTYFWNYNQSIQVAKLAKLKYPDAKIVFGGPMVPISEDEMRLFLTDLPFIDVAVSGEGEVVFKEIILAAIEGNDLSHIQGLSYRDQNGHIIWQGIVESIESFDHFPSPYLDGTFDEVLETSNNNFTGTLLETNRGCPFTCSFCYWGGPESKIIKFPLERVYEELNWISQNKFDYISGCDANFGILKRDLEITKYIAELNRKTGYPKYFAINWTKNTNMNVLNIMDTLKDSDVTSMLTASVQSYNPATLEAIKRKNLKPEKFEEILTAASEKGMTVYSELILGLPLETYETFVNGINKVMAPNLNYHFNLYYLYLIPGSEMSGKEFVKKYQIETRQCDVSFERTKIKDFAVTEYENIVVSHSTMPVEDWRKSFTFGYFAKALYGYRLLFFIFNYIRREFEIEPAEVIEYIVSICTDNPKYQTTSNALKKIEELQDSILNKGHEIIKIENVNTFLHPEGAMLVVLLSDKRKFYAEMYECIDQFFDHKKIIADRTLYMELFVYQYCRIPSWNDNNHYRIHFSYNISKYFDSEEDFQQRPANQILGNGDTFPSIDQYLSRQIYGGYKFHLPDVEDVDNKMAKDMDFSNVEDIIETILSFSKRTSHCEEIHEAGG